MNYRISSSSLQFRENSLWLYFPSRWPLSSGEERCAAGWWERNLHLLSINKFHIFNTHSFKFLFLLLLGRPTTTTTPNHNHHPAFDEQSQRLDDAVDNTKRRRGSLTVHIWSLSHACMHLNTACSMSFPSINVSVCGDDFNFFIFIWSVFILLLSVWLFRLKMSPGSSGKLSHEAHRGRRSEKNPPQVVSERSCSGVFKVLVERVFIYFIFFEGQH